MVDHVRIGVDLQRLQEGRQADAVDGLADALVLQRVLGEEVHHLAAKVDGAYS